MPETADIKAGTLSRSSSHCSPFRVVPLVRRHGASDPRVNRAHALGMRIGQALEQQRIHDGKPNTAMGAWSYALSDDEIWVVLAYVRTLRQE